MRYLDIKIRGKSFLLYEDGVYLGFLFPSQIKDIVSEKDFSPETGLKVSDEEVEALKDKIIDGTFEKGVSYLAETERCGEDLRLKLLQKRYPEYAISEAIDKLYEFNYLNDERFMESFIRSYMNQKSRSLIMRELSMRHISLQDFDEVYDRISEEEDVDEDKAIEKLLKRFEGQDMSDERVRRRAAALLVRHGFSFDRINNHLT
ncbi:MAG: regulatory protein RecX [Eubacterium sp.]|nr:regulatory protein RecX [Eubacterium sp.]